MAKNSFNASVPQALFDLRASFDNRQLSNILHAWEAGDKTAKAAKNLLRPFRAEWTVVLSDSSGLSKLSAELPLSEVLALIQGPKEHMYANGTALWGVTIWIWAADNTAMFYHSKIGVGRVLGMLAAQREAMRHERIKIGIGVHTGTFYRLWDNFYGEEYAVIDEIAENHTTGDEIAVTDSVWKILGKAPGFEFSKREDLRVGTPVYRLEKFPKTVLEEVLCGKYHFALPFPFRFHSFLKTLSKNRDPERIRTVMDRYVEHRTVVLVDIPKKEFANTEVSILEGISADFSLRKAIRSALRGFGGQEIKTWGGMGILVFSDPKSALDFSKALRGSLGTKKIPCRIGIDESDVLLFRLGRRGFDIAGTAVNVASKLAQDYGEYGKIYMTDSAGKHLDIHGGIPFSIEISQVNMRGIML